MTQVNLSKGTQLEDVFVGAGFKFRINTETMGANKTLVIGDKTVHFLDPTTARDVVLPAEADSIGLCFIIKNTANGAETITVKDDAAATVAVVAQNEGVILICDGTTWEGFVTTET